MSGTDAFEGRLREAWPPSQWRDVSRVVALSGGADSVALLRGLLALGGEGAGKLVAAHFNHGIRGPRSDADQEFVERLCDRLAVPCVIGHRGRPWADSAEASLRAARYGFLLRVAEQQGARYLITGHTADDQAETILHRVVRGTGLGGLAGIPRARVLSQAVSIIRPMLLIRRKHVIAYLRRLEQPYVEDASNYDEKYTRNRIRHELLPRLRADYNDGIVEALLRLGQLAGEAQQVVADQVDDLTESAVRLASGGCVCVDCRGMGSLRPFLVRELFVRIWRDQGWPRQAMAFQHWELLCLLAQGGLPERRVTLPGPVDVRRSDHHLWLTRSAG